VVGTELPGQGYAGGPTNDDPPPYDDAESNMNIWLLGGLPGAAFANSTGVTVFPGATSSYVANYSYTLSGGCQVIGTACTYAAGLSNDAGTLGALPNQAGYAAIMPTLEAAIQKAGIGVAPIVGAAIQSEHVGVSR
jgi:hypothetical protein